MMWPNERASLDAAMTLWLHAERPWHGASDVRRWNTDGEP